MDSRALLAVLAVWIIIVAVPFGVYGAFSALTGLQPPGDSPWLFEAGTTISKLGTAIAFVAIFVLARDVFGPQWLLYAGIWLLMYAIGEVGQAITPSYSWQEAIAGVISEAIYFPLSALTLTWLLRG
jgi:hypothetical protein